MGATGVGGRGGAEAAAVAAAVGVCEAAAAAAALMAIRWGSVRRAVSVLSAGGSARRFPPCALALSARCAGLLCAHRTVGDRVGEDTRTSGMHRQHASERIRLQAPLAGQQSAASCFLLMIRSGPWTEMMVENMHKSFDLFVRPQ